MKYSSSTAEENEYLVPFPLAYKLRNENSIYFEEGEKSRVSGQLETKYLSCPQVTYTCKVHLVFLHNMKLLCS